MAARSRTLLQLLEDLRVAVDLKPFTTTTYVTKTMATRWLNEAAQTLSRTYASFGLYSKTTTFNVVSGTKEYALATIASDFACVQNMIYPLNGEPARVRRAEDIDLIDMQSSSSQGWASGYAFYLVFGENLIVTDPRGPYTVTMRYCPELPVYNAGGTAIPDFTADTDYILEKGCMADWLVQDAAMKIMRKQRIDPTPWFQAREELSAQMKQTTMDRDVHNAERVRNTWGEMNYTGDIRRSGGLF